MQINNQNMLPRYEWPVDYIDAMCFSSTYQPEIPTAKMMEMKQLSEECLKALFVLRQKRGAILDSPFLSERAKNWHREVYFRQDNNALFYCKISFNAA